MYIVLIALITVSAPLALLVSVICMVKAPNQYKKWLWIYILAMAIIAYSYTPTYTNDLMRYFMMIDQCKELPFSQAFNWADDGLVIKNLLFWCLSKIDEPHLLQAITIGGLYGVTAYITCESFKKDKSKLAIVILLQVLILPFHLANNNIRNIITFSFMILAVYRDIIQKKKNALTLILYIAPIFIHMTGVVVLFARVCVWIFKKHFKAGLIATFAIPSVFLGLYQILRTISLPGNIGKIISRVIWKTYTSILSNSEYAESMKTSGYVNACRFVMFFICVGIIILTLMYLKKGSDLNDSKKGFMIFNMYFCSITCIWIILGAVKFWVFGVASIIGSGPVLSIYFEKCVVL